MKGGRVTDGENSTKNLSASIKGAVQLLLLQIWSRMSTFILNQIALRFITREVLGIVALEMELLSSTILFLSRESIRMALLRSMKDLKGSHAKDSKYREEVERQKAVNMTWISIFIGFLLSAGITAYFNLINPKDGSYNPIVTVFCIAAFFELLSEPMYVIAVNKLQFDLRLRVEGIAVLLKCVSILGLLLISPRTSTGRVDEFRATMSFACSQLVYSFALVFGYAFFYLYRQGNSVSFFLPKKVQENPKSMSVAWSFTTQGILKHILTEGDKILSVYMITAAIQGDYALVEKYGSLIARMIFQPLEETGRAYFSRAVGSKNDYRSNIETASRLLTIILRLHIVLGLFFIFLGTNYTGLVVDILAGRTFSSGSAPTVLAIYCIYVPIMGVNGITEAYLQALADKKTLTRQSYWMGVCWAAFVAIAYVSINLLDLGAIGLVLANCVNLIMRIGFAWAFVQKNLLVLAVERCADEDQEGSKELKKRLQSDLSLRNLLPQSAMLWTGFAIIWVATFYSNQVLGWYTVKQKLSHIAVGTASFGFSLVLM
ncbi:Oligosaccharide translocation protein rft1 [Dinochytrium kinnereticum]|nr:Oligosaccharide translocation protein rft1 [Dinochytrium kinnereticum]